MNHSRSEIPYNDSGIILKIPDITISQLGNIKIYKYQDNSQPLVNFKINFKKGASSDIIPGTANFTMIMLQTGTLKHSANEISEKFETLGASSFFNAYWDESAVGFSCLESYFEQCFETIVDCIFNPAFEDSELNRQRERISASILQNTSDPNFMAQVAFTLGMFRNHPYGHIRSGNLSELAQITKSDILEFYQLLINKSEISIIVTGNFDDDRISNLIENNFSVLKNNFSESDLPFLQVQEYKNVIVGKEDALQTNLRIGKPIIGHSNPDFPAFQVINTIFGGYFLSKLNNILREVKGLTYGIYSYIDIRKLSNIFTISTSINADKTKESIDDIFDISLKMSHEILDEIEIARSVEYMTGSFARSLETSKQITGVIQTIDNYNLSTNYLQDFYSKIRVLTPDDIFEVQKKYFSHLDYMIAAAGDAKLLSETFSNYGNYEIIEI